MAVMVQVLLYQEMIYFQCVHTWFRPYETNRRRRSLEMNVLLKAEGISIYINNTINTLLARTRSPLVTGLYEPMCTLKDTVTSNLLGGKYIDQG